MCIASNLLLSIIIIISTRFPTQVILLFTYNYHIIIACRNTHYKRCFGILDGEVVSEDGGVDASVAQFVCNGSCVLCCHMYFSSQYALFYFYVMVNLNVIVKVVA